METKQLQLVTFEQAKRLKKLGFDCVVNDYYTSSGMNLNNVEPVDFNNHKRSIVTGEWEKGNGVCFSAPSAALAMKWLRDKGEIGYVAFDWQLYMFYYVWKKKGVDFEFVSEYAYETYEEAESTMLDEMLNVLEEEKD